MKQGLLKRPLYFLNSSNGLNPSDPNSIRDMGKARNCVYTIDDETDQFARNVTWKDLIAGDEHLEELMRSTGY